MVNGIFVLREPSEKEQKQIIDKKAKIDACLSFSSVLKIECLFCLIPSYQEYIWLRYLQCIISWIVGHIAPINRYNNQMKP